MIIAGLLIIFIATLFCVTGYLWLMGMAFRRDILWGTLLVIALLGRLTLIISPVHNELSRQIMILLDAGSMIGLIAIAASDWEHARSAFCWWMVGGLVLVGGSFALRDYSQKQRMGETLRFTWVFGENKPTERLRKATHGESPPWGSGGWRSSWLTPASAPAVATPAPPMLVSNLPPVLDGRRRKADPGVFYVKSRATIMTGSGVRAIRPGDTVYLKERMKGGKLRVSFGPDIFVVDAAALTDDLAEAHEAEERDFRDHGGRM